MLAYAFLVTYQVYYPLERIGLTAAIVDGLALFVLIIAARSPSRRAGDRAGHPGDRQRQLRVLCAVAGVWAIIGALAILPVKGVR